MRVDSIENINYSSDIKRVNSSEVKSSEFKAGSKEKETSYKPELEPILKDNNYSEDEVIQMIEDANKEFITYDRKFEFAIHEKTKQITVKVLDSVTDEVIRELPPEKILDMLAGIWEVAGILVDESV